MQGGRGRISLSASRSSPEGWRETQPASQEELPAPRASISRRIPCPVKGSLPFHSRTKAGRGREEAAAVLRAALGSPAPSPKSGRAGRGTSGRSFGVDIPRSSYQLTWWLCGYVGAPWFQGRTLGPHPLSLPQAWVRPPGFFSVWPLKPGTWAGGTCGIVGGRVVLLVPSANHLLLLLQMGLLVLLPGAVWELGA